MNKNTKPVIYLGRTRTKYISRREDRSNRASNVVDDDSGSCTSVVHWCQAVVPLLARSIPDLELHSRIVHRQRLREERCPDRRFLPPPQSLSK